MLYEIAAWLSAGAAVAAAMVSVIALFIARRSNVLAREANKFALKSNSIAEDAAASARRSADVAEAAETRQRGAEAQKDEHHDVSWRFDRVGNVDRFLINLGPHDAQDVTVTISGAGMEPMVHHIERVDAGQRIPLPLGDNWFLTQAVARVRWVSPLGAIYTSPDLPEPGRAYFL